ncbi:hypothetical protein [Arenimonas caeni]|nr:hypothetical protein [Arenimonas caeni]
MERFAPLSLSDFLPVFSYRGRDGVSYLWVNWPVVVALAVGVALGRWLGV